MHFGIPAILNWNSLGCWIWKQYDNEDNQTHLLLYWTPFSDCCCCCGCVFCALTIWSPASTLNTTNTIRRFILRRSFPSFSTEDLFYDKLIDDFAMDFARSRSILSLYLFRRFVNKAVMQTPPLAPIKNWSFRCRNKTTTDNKIETNW